MGNFRNFVKTALVTVVLVLFMASPVLASGGLLTIEGTAGISAQQFKGNSASGSVALVGSTLTLSRTNMNFRGVGVGSNASGALTVASTNLGGCGCPDISGSGHFTANSSGTIDLRNPGPCCCHNNNGYVGQVKGTYGTSSTVNVSVN
jgi:hypothetical protein